MIDVASRELCKELYKLSGWTNDGPTWFKAKGKHWKTYNRIPTVKNSQDRLPAYDLGFVLRKLPKHLSGPSPLTLTYIIGNYWQASYGYYESVQRENADTPEDAAAKLCIQLIKQGILKGKEV